MSPSRSGLGIVDIKVHFGADLTLMKHFSQAQVFKHIILIAEFHEMLKEKCINRFGALM